jgi:hypothetical protein
MTEIVRLLLLLVLAGAVLTFAGSTAIWFMDEERRLRRALKYVLKAEPETFVVARGRGRGAGFSFASGLLAVAWDAGAWCLIYRIDELVGAEIIVDGVVVARAFRGEPRRALDQVVAQADRVTLRLVFDDPAHPDFDLDLWLDGDENRKLTAFPADAVKEANRWLARAEAILRRPGTTAAAPHAAPPLPTPARAPDVLPRPAPPPPLFADLEPDDDEEEDRDPDDDETLT